MLFQGCFDVIRSQVLVRVGARLDQKVAPLAHRVAIDMPRFGFSTSEALERGRDVDTVRGFLGSQGPAALFDLPWMPIYLAFIYFLHPALGALTFAGAFVLAVLTVVSEIMTKRLSISTRKAAMARNTIADSNARSADVLKAMGFAGRAVGRFNDANREHLKLQTKANDITGTFAAVSRVLRMLLQSAVLGLGAYLTIKGELTAGAIIACSVASARALAPVDLAIGNWKPFIAARMAYQRLRDTVVALAAADEPMKLPVPRQRLSVEKITVAVPGSGQIILSDVAFELEAGQALGIIGPSAGGKTTMVRALTGIWPVLRGSVRLDGADLDTMARGGDRTACRLSSAGSQPDGCDNRRQHLPVRTSAGFPEGYRSGQGGWRARHDPENAGRLPNSARPAGYSLVGRSAAARGVGACALRQPVRRRHG